MKLWRPALLALALGLGIAASTALAADVRRLEAVGVVPLTRAQQGSSSALDDAIQAALREAVSRVARSFLMEADVREGGGEEVDIEEVLGSRMVPYTSRFRILDDRGEAPAMFAEDPAVTSEYVVVVEVHVDADRVEERLLESGLLRHKEGASATSKVTLEVRGLSDYRAYEAIRVLLTEDMGALAAMPRGFKLGVALIDLELVGAANRAHASRAEEVAAWLVDQQSPELQFQALEVGDDRLVVTVDWTEPAADDPAPVGAWR